MRTKPHDQALQQAYTLCYWITACPQAARQAALEALTDRQPLRKAVMLCTQRAPALAAPQAQAGSTDLERALFTLPWNQRLALILLDHLQLPLEEAARWAQIPCSELKQLCYAGRLALAQASA